ncbi:hypothetical protein Gogos_022127 [Gossypium gossypioides]|uniref:DUF7745 domain-containing protein n=1 Tax=Gossypium gossypioides TaxID=34282 RepID=A0A7J9D2U6_GOSGO|nr:hypothetical protein [Gossypium gossypioides]
MALLQCSKSQVNKIYSRAANAPFLRRLMNITGMSEQWVIARIKQKGDNKCISWRNLKYVVLVHPDVKKRVDIFALSIYGLVIFPRALGHIDETITDLFDRLDKGVTPVLAILAKTFRSLNACRRVGEGRFIGCAQLLLAWFHSHFWKVDKVSYRVFSENYSPATPRRDDISVKNGWQFFRSCKKRTLSGELRGYFQTKFYTGVVILIGSLCLESGELLVMPRY